MMLLLKSVDISYLIVDEAHRLRQRKNLTQYKTFDENNRKLKLGANGTELDWIMKKSRHQILLYDEKQSIKSTDINPKKIEELKKQTKLRKKELKIQIRCNRGGKRYIDYIENIFAFLLFLTMLQSFY